MTKPEFQERFLVTVEALWPSLVPRVMPADGEKERQKAREKVGQLWGMFNRYTLEDATKAIRRAAVEYPVPPTSKGWMWVLNQARDMLPKQSTSHKLPSIEDKLQQHREHYAGCRGWKYPGDEVIKGYIIRGEPTPLQVQTFKDIAEIIRNACKGKEASE
jgi:hypothetical protein